MAIASTTVWEIRSAATAGNVNGGGFNPSNATPGTDFSQQNTAQYTFSDLASTTGTTTPSVVTSASHTFVSADCGNIIHVNSGTSWTAGWYEIVSVSGGAATLDRAVGAAATLTAGTYHVGGAMSLNSATDSTFMAVPTAGNIVWMNGTLTLGAAISSHPAGTTTNIVQILGYQTSRGDNPTGSNRPTVTGGSNSWSFGVECQIKNLIFSSSSSPTVAIGVMSMIVNCKIANVSSSANNALNIVADCLVLNCEISSYSGAGVSSTNVNNVITGNYIHNCTNGVIHATTGNAIIVNNLITNCSVAALSFSATAVSDVLIYGNTLYGAENKTGVGVNITTAGTLSDAYKILNNIIYGFTTGLLNSGNAQTVCYVDFNDFFNNTTDVNNFQKGANDIALNPTFSSVAQLKGTTATTSGSTLTDSGQNFSTVTDNVDMMYLVSGTGITAGQYLITSHTTTTVTFDRAPGTSAVGDKVYQVTTGNNFGIGTNVQGKGSPGALGPSTTGNMDIGAVQAASSGGSGNTYSRGRVVNR